MEIIAPIRFSGLTTRLVITVGRVVRPRESVNEKQTIRMSYASGDSPIAGEVHRILGVEIT